MVIIADYTEETPVSLQELCVICNIPADFIHHLVAYEIVHPAGASPEEWIFQITELQRVKTATRLHRDLEVNVAGIGVVLDLLDEIEELRSQLDLINKHYR